MDRMKLAAELVRLAKSLVALRQRGRSYDISVRGDMVVLSFSWNKDLGSAPIPVEALQHMIQDFLADVRKDEGQLGIGVGGEHATFIPSDSSLYAYVTVPAEKVRYRGAPEGLYEWLEEELRWIPKNPARIKKQEERLHEYLFGDE